MFIPNTIYETCPNPKCVRGTVIDKKDHIICPDCYRRARELRDNPDKATTS